MFENLTFMEYLILLLIGLLFFKEQITPWIRKILGMKDTPVDTTPIWAERLIAHFNHDTTDHHNLTHEKLDQLLDMEKDEHKKHEKIGDTINKMSNTLENIKEYGVPLRTRQ